MICVILIHDLREDVYTEIMNWYEIMKETGSQFHNTQHEYYINSLRLIRFLCKCWKNPCIIRNLSSFTHFYNQTQQFLKKAQAKLPTGDSRLRGALRYNGECYTEVVNEQLGAIIDTLRDEFGGQCLMKIGRKRVTQRFSNLFGEFDDEIRDKLEAFSENPLYSAPYFINARTVAYSYKIDDVLLKTREEKE